MMKLEAIKNGKSEIVITEDSFEFLLSCLDNQKFIQSAPQNQIVIDNYNDECRKILHQKYVFETCEDDYFLFKRYMYQDCITPWSSDDVGKVYELYKDTKIIYKKPKKLFSIVDDDNDDDEPMAVDPKKAVGPEDSPWLIERSIRHDNEYLTISEDGIKNRPWKKYEIEKINKLFNNDKIKEKNYYKEELWNDQLSKMDINVIEKFIRKAKIIKL